MTRRHVLDRDCEQDQQRPEMPYRPEPEAIRPGMVVETTEGDLGERDVSKPRVKDVVRDAAGRVQELVVEKGVVFKKKIDIPAGRVAGVQQPKDGDPADGEVVIAAREPEIESLGPTGTEALPGHRRDKREAAGDEDGPLDSIEENAPTVEGLRRMEGDRERVEREGTPPNTPAKPEEAERPVALLKTVGPGFLAGMSGNDSSAVTSYAVNGATAGFGQLWLMLLATPLYQAVQYTCAQIGRVTQRGFGAIVRDSYGRKVAATVSLALIAGNLALIAGDLTAIGSGLELITGLRWTWFVVPVAAAL